MAIHFTSIEVCAVFHTDMLQWQKSLQLTAWENMSLLLIWFIKITAETTLLQSYVPAIYKLHEHIF